jgi:hypothetical protein
MNQIDLDQNRASVVTRTGSAPTLNIMESEGLLL